MLDTDLKNRVKSTGFSRCAPLEIVALRRVAMNIPILPKKLVSRRASVWARRAILCSVLTGAFVVAPAIVAPARADDFATVAAKDPLYRSMKIVAASGWNSAPANVADASSLLTRYEMALQTAEAIYTVTARHDADAAWDAAASGAALRALRQLTVSLRPELQKLGVDTNAALRLLTTLTAPRATTSPAANTSSPNASLANASSANEASSTGLLLSNGRALGNDTLRGSGSLARRFRIESAVSALEREANDPLSSGVSAHVQGASLAFDVTRGLSLRAGYAQRGANALNLASLGLQDASAQSGLRERSLSSGVDFSLRNGLLFSTQIERLSGQSGSVGTRLSGGVGLSAWQNRLSLVAKLSRLTPEDVRSMAPSTIAGLNLGVDVSRNLSLNLLYQRLFSAPTPGRSGVLAGGVSIKF